MRGLRGPTPPTSQRVVAESLNSLCQGYLSEGLTSILSGPLRCHEHYMNMEQQHNAHKLFKKTLNPRGSSRVPQWPCDGASCRGTQSKIFGRMPRGKACSLSTGPITVYAEMTSNGIECTSILHRFCYDPGSTVNSRIFPATPSQASRLLFRNNFRVGLNGVKVGFERVRGPARPLNTHAKGF